MNRISATIKLIKTSGGNALVDLETGDCHLTAMLAGVDELPTWIESGMLVYAIIIETEISIAKDFTGKISMRNQLDCMVAGIDEGSLMSTVSLMTDIFVLKSAISTRAVKHLELKEGDRVSAFIKANEISLMEIK